MSRRTPRIYRPNDADFGKLDARLSALEPHIFEVNITGLDSGTWHERVLTVVAVERSQAFEKARHEMAARGFDESRQLSARVIATSYGGRCEWSPEQISPTNPEA